MLHELVALALLVSAVNRTAGLLHTSAALRYWVGPGARQDQGRRTAISDGHDILIVDRSRLVGRLIGQCLAHATMICTYALAAGWCWRLR